LRMKRGAQLGTSETSSIFATSPPRGPYPKSFEEVTERLQTARKNIIKNGYIAKYDDAELLDLVKSGELANERFHVRIVQQSADKVLESSLGFPRPGTKRAPYWTTTFEQMEAADTDPYLIGALSGITNFKPDAPFTLIIIDSHNLPINAERVSFVPTYENMIDFGKKELAPDFMERGIKDSNIMAKIMTPKMSEEFEQHFKKFQSLGNNPFDPKRFRRYVHYEMGNLSKIQEQHLLARYRVCGEFGANELFAGNGLTKVDKESKWGRTIEQEFGLAEVLTYERDPLKVRQLNENGNVVTLLTPEPI
ncbi:hypothetical protein, partial [Vibrio sagamiensis]|uniref:hypothetical protein n=2 Tax=Vibrio sagamiensis TaxID=512650 RepID=UPI001D127A10